MTRTPEQWLSLPKAELDVALPEVLTPGPWKHGLSRKGSVCPKCNRHKYTRQNGKPKATPCSVPDPIDSEDWNVAKCWQGKCTIRVFEKHVTDVIRVSTCTPGLSVIDAMRVLSLMCRPVDAKIPLIAAAMAVERNKDGR